jgi:hypothetical protein
MFIDGSLHAEQVSCDGITVPLQYITVPYGVFGEEQTNRISPRAFSDKIVSNSKKNKTKTNRLMGWIKNGLNKFLNQNFVRQTFPPKHQMPGFRFISHICMRQGNKLRAMDNPPCHCCRSSLPTGIGKIESSLTLTCPHHSPQQ